MTRVRISSSGAVPITESARASPPARSGAAAEEEPHEAVVVLDQQLTLPQPVDTAGITCTYRDGLLRIQVPIVAPALGDDHRELMAALEQEANDAGSAKATASAPTSTAAGAS